MDFAEASNGIPSIHGGNQAFFQDCLYPTGKTGEALALFNVMGAVVEGNQIITTNNKNESYAAGLHIAMFGKAPAGMDSAVLRVKKNVIKYGDSGFRQEITLGLRVL